MRAQELLHRYAGTAKGCVRVFVLALAWIFLTGCALFWLVVYWPQEDGRPESLDTLQEASPEHFPPNDAWLLPPDPPEGLQAEEEHERSERAD